MSATATTSPSTTAMPSGVSAFKPGGELLRITDLHAFYGESHILHAST